MFGVVISIFAICWFPYHAYFIYSYFNPGIMKVLSLTKSSSPRMLLFLLKAWYTQHMYLGFYWLAMANCCVNPLVYYSMNKR